MFYIESYLQNNIESYVICCFLITSEIYLHSAGELEIRKCHKIAHTIMIIAGT